ncbi:MAG: hypothetical protein MPL62_10970, partial [Alphaproteobacteria bacterium]|nr:hypothetical protein [Alphaproteobacteria bacterium]
MAAVGRIGERFNDSDNATAAIARGEKSKKSQSYPQWQKQQFFAFLSLIFGKKLRPPLSLISASLCRPAISPALPRRKSVKNGKNRGKMRQSFLRFTR